MPASGRRSGGCATSPQSGPRADRPPRIHDLRHTFAVRTLLGWYQAGEDVQARLPVLSTYLGHRDPRSTYWYYSDSRVIPILAPLRVWRACGLG